MEFEQMKELMVHLERSNLHKIMVKKGDFEFSAEKAICSASFVAQPTPTIALPLKAPEKSDEVQGVFVTSPMVGTYYGSPAPDQPPFVKTGDTVHEGTVVCIIEAMKVMNEVKAGVSGVVAETLMHSGQVVEFGTRLFRIVSR